LLSGDVARSGKDKQQNRWQNVLQVSAPLVLCCVWSVAGPAVAHLWANRYLQCLRKIRFSDAGDCTDTDCFSDALLQDVFINVATTEFQCLDSLQTVPAAEAVHCVTSMSTEAVQCVELMSTEAVQCVKLMWHTGGGGS